MSLKHLTKDLTSYDLLKTFAVIFMLVDHVGYYFFDGNDWLRVAGRMCVPVWFFLIGYARSRDLGPKLWIGGTILVVANLIAGLGVIPVNILFTILIVRVVLDPVMARATRNPEALWQISTMLLILSFPTSYLFEYGTLAVIMAMFGWLVRHQYEYPNGEMQTVQYFFFAYASFTLIQMLLFQFKGNAITVLAGGLLAVMSVLMFFKPISFKGTGSGIFGVLLSPFRFTGRWTLEIYVVHLLLFKALGVMFFPERFTLFDWRLAPAGILELAVSGVN